MKVLEKDQTTAMTLGTGRDHETVTDIPKQYNFFPSQPLVGSDCYSTYNMTKKIMHLKGPQLEGSCERRQPYLTLLLIMQGSATCYYLYFIYDSLINAYELSFLGPVMEINGERVKFDLH